MRIVLSIVAGLMILVGGVWIFQGIGILLGSFMSGQNLWAIIGGFAIAAGIVILVLVNRRKAPPPKE
jgi:hypothetical protein